MHYTVLPICLEYFFHTLYVICDQRDPGAATLVNDKLLLSKHRLEKVLSLLLQKGRISRHSQGSEAVEDD